MSRSRMFILAISALSFPMYSIAQESPQMADKMRANGKIYVVVVVCLIILTGLFLYVWKLDRKISKLEKETQKPNL